MMFEVVRYRAQPPSDQAEVLGETFQRVLRKERHVQRHPAAGLAERVEADLAAVIAGGLRVPHHSVPGTAQDRGIELTLKAAERHDPVRVRRAVPVDAVHSDRELGEPTEVAPVRERRVGRHIEIDPTTVLHQSIGYPGTQASIHTEGGSAEKVLAIMALEFAAAVILNTACLALSPRRQRGRPTGKKACPASLRYSCRRRCRTTPSFPIVAAATARRTLLEDQGVRDPRYVDRDDRAIKSGSKRRMATTSGL